MSAADLSTYFSFLDYDFDAGQQEGLSAFFGYLHRFGWLTELPGLEFIKV
jgi:predicted solute-binding protein